MQIKLNRTAIRDQLLKGEKTKEVIKKYGDNAYNSISHIEGYVMEDRNYPERVGVAIFAKEYPAVADNLENNTLLKAVKK